MLLIRSSVYMSEMYARSFPQYFKSFVISYECAFIQVNPASAFFFFETLKFDFQSSFCALNDLYAVDYPKLTERFELNYLFFSLSHPLFRPMVSFRVSLNQPVLSVCSLFLSSGWLEREIWDLFGVYFTGNNDLRRILTDYGFIGHPMRKDFPLIGYTEIRYDDDQKRIVFEPVNLTQEFRHFSLTRPW